MPQNTTAAGHETGHPVLQAIAEFRDAMNRLIDEQKALTLSRAFEADVAEPRPGPVVPAPSPAALGPSAPPLVPVPRHPVAPAPRSYEAIAESAAPPRDDPTASSEPRDPRQRLDALARLLDKRVRPSGPPADPTRTEPTKDGRGDRP